MKRQNGYGQLEIEGPDFRDSFNVNWDIVYGDELSSEKTWRANIGFNTLRVPNNILTVIFKALSTTSVKTKLITDDGLMFECHILDILNLADDGAIEVGSLSFPAGKIKWDENAKLD